MAQSATCPVCSTGVTKVDELGPLMRFDCDRCGVFALAHSVIGDLPEWFRQDPVRASLISIQSDDAAKRTAHPNTPETVETYWRRDHLPAKGTSR